MPRQEQIILPPLSDISLHWGKNWEERRERSLKPNSCVLCRSPFALMTYFISTSCSCRRLPIADRAALEFTPHHPTMLWPSNSQPLWPEQINNKPGTFRRSSGGKQMDGIRAQLTSTNIPCGVLSRKQDKYAFPFLFNNGKVLS